MRPYDSLMECYVHMADMRSTLEEHELPEKCYCDICNAARAEIDDAYKRVFALECIAPYEYI